MASEIEFAAARVASSTKPGVQLHLPMYVERQVQEPLKQLVSAKGVELSTRTNELLEADIELIEIGR